MKKLICLCASMMMLAACSKKNDPVENVRQAAKDRDLQKTFVSDCDAAPAVAVGTAINTGFQGKTAGYKTTYKFTGANVTKKIEAYATTNCQGDPNYEYVETGTFDPNKDAKTKINDGSYPINITYDKVTLKVISDEGVKVAEAGKFCGFEHWDKNKEQDVTGQSSNSACYGTKVPRKVFTRYRVDNNTLYLGSDKSGQTENDRASKLEATKYMAK